MAILNKNNRALTLLEVLVALVIGSLVIIVSATLLTRSTKTFKSIESALDENTLPREILHMIAKDVEDVVSPGADAFLHVQNKTYKGHNETRLEITSRVYDKKRTPVILKRVVWQSKYDPGLDRIVLYRSRSGLATADVILDTQAREHPDSLVFVPLTDELTYFKVFIGNMQEEPLSQWLSSRLPEAIKVEMSFAQPIDTITKEQEFAPEDLLSRTIVVDMTRRISFIVPDIKDYEKNNLEDPNDVDKKASDQENPEDKKPQESTTKEVPTKESGNIEDTRDELLRVKGVSR